MLWGAHLVGAKRPPVEGREEQARGPAVPSTREPTKNTAVPRLGHSDVNGSLYKASAQTVTNRWLRFVLIFGSMFVLIEVLWGLGIYSLGYSGSPKGIDYGWLGSFGDAFAPISAFIASIGTALAAYAVVQAQQELSQQQRDLKTALEALTTQSSATQKLADQTQKQVRESMFANRINWLATQLAAAKLETDILSSFARHDASQEEGLAMSEMLLALETVASEEEALEVHRTHAERQLREVAHLKKQLRLLHRTHVKIMKRIKHETDA